MSFGPIGSDELFDLREQHHELAARAKRLRAALEAMTAERDAALARVVQLSGESSAHQRDAAGWQGEAEHQRARVRDLEAALERCSELFSDISGDYTDPGWECNEGHRVIDAALAKQPNLPPRTEDDV